MSSIAPPNPDPCANCKAPINYFCGCPSCPSGDRIYCHVCLEMYRAAISKPGLARAQNEWKADQDEKRRRMGL